MFKLENNVYLNAKFAKFIYVMFNQGKKNNGFGLNFNLKKKKQIEYILLE
jgi:hypothetical protein